MLARASYTDRLISEYDEMSIASRNGCNRFDGGQSITMGRISGTDELGVTITKRHDPPDAAHIRTQRSGPLRRESG